MIPFFFDTFKVQANFDFERARGGESVLVPCRRKTKREEEDRPGVGGCNVIGFLNERLEEDEEERTCVDFPKD